MENYFGRFCLILQLLRKACKETTKDEIEPETIENAIKLVKYYTSNALKVRKVVSDPTEQLTEQQKRLYDALPDVFTTSVGLEFAEGVNMKERAFKSFLKNRALFKWIKQGQYEKLL